ncbi:tyrosine-type recombinase/integrase [Halobacteriales archaeon Cl-PHB]
MGNTPATDDDSDGGETDDPAGTRDALADAFDRTVDPLADLEATFTAAGIAPAEPFEVYLSEVIAERDITAHTREQYRVAFRHWREHMATQDRHAACPNADHVRAFAEHEREAKDNHPATIREKLRKLASAYEYWQADPAFPHPSDYDPFALATATLDFDEPEPREFPRIPLPELREVVRAITHVRDRAIVGLQLKLGLRASELCNVRLSDVALAQPDLAAHYDALGAHPVLADRPRALYIPHDRPNNKSERPRVLPLDDETHDLVADWLFVRPDTGAPWVFLDQAHHDQLSKQGVNRVWKAAFHPAYAATDTRRAVTSIYGRHRFTTHWRVDQDVPRAYVKYLRGDTTNHAIDGTSTDGIDAYVHTYYEDVAPVYRERTFQLGR